MEVWKEGPWHLQQAKSTPLQLLGQINPPKAPEKKRGEKKAPRNNGYTPHKSVR
jgi:hypothetical protein